MRIAIKNLPFSIKKQQDDKPGSVLFREEKRLSFIYVLRRRKTQAVYPPTWDEQPS